MNTTHFGKALVAAALALPLLSQAASISLFGDKDCFNTGGACVEDGTTWLPGGWGFSPSGSDPAPTDTVTNTSSVSWTQTFAPGSYTGAMMSMRTAGIADISGPYTVFADGVAIGDMPLDGFGHILVETFDFVLDSALLADGSVTFSFTPGSGDTWAIDYVEITGTAGSVPVPGTLALAGLGLLALGAQVRRRAARA